MVAELATLWVILFFCVVALRLFWKLSKKAASWRPRRRPEVVKQLTPEARVEELRQQHEETVQMLELADLDEDEHEAALMQVRKNYLNALRRIVG
jgi:flagellar biosynthesis/type III secretory pathway M-ring protein FliF/YscJ